jgi:cytochrome c553
MMKLLTGVVLGTLVTTTAQAADMANQGEYLATIMDCGGCHEIPSLGIFYPPNLTPDADTGLGSWTEADIIKALRTGVRPDGRELAPVMPWRSYAKLTDSDIQSLASYLKNLKPVRNPVPRIAASSEVATGPYLTVAFPKK